MRRAIVTLDGPQTGSVSLPEVLTRLRPDLGAVGLCYTTLPPGDGKSRRPEARHRAGLACLAAALGETDADTVIVSCEQPPDPAILAALFARFGFALEVAIVVRPQAEELAAAYARRIQALAEARSFRGFVRREGFSDRYDHAVLLDPWRRATGDRIHAVPALDRRFPAPLLARLIAELGLTARLDPLLGPGDLFPRALRAPGPFAVEASRRLHALGLPRRADGRGRRLGHLLDNLARARGLDAMPFRGEAKDALAAIEAYHGEANERLAALCWGRNWDSVVARAPGGPANELAGRTLSPDCEAEVAGLVADVAAHAGYHAPPAWLRRIDTFVEDGIGRLTDLIGRPTWRLR